MVQVQSNYDSRKENLVFLEKLKKNFNKSLKKTRNSTKLKFSGKSTRNSTRFFSRIYFFKFYKEDLLYTRFCRIPLNVVTLFIACRIFGICEKKLRLFFLETCFRDSGNFLVKAKFQFISVKFRFSGFHFISVKNEFGETFL